MKKDRSSNANHVLYLQVSTYALPVDDVLEVLSDTVVVHESAASHIQRLTKVSPDA
jgi:hypothetical protein